jgi:uncharacterized protein YejL (UPF0352 family)
MGRGQRQRHAVARSFSETLQRVLSEYDRQMAEKNKG